MHNYYPEAVWFIDKLLLLLAFFLGAAVIMYSGVREALNTRRIRNLVFIKNNLRRLAESAEDASRDVCPAIIGRVTTGQFMEIVRDKELVLPLGFERELRECFIASGKIGAIERIARSSHNKWLRIQAIISLGYTNSPEALQILKKTILEEDEDIAYYSMLSLGQIKNNASARILLDFLGKHVFSGHRTVSLLASFPDTIIEEVVARTHDRDHMVRFWAIKLVTQFRSKQYTQRIEEMTLDDSPDVRAAACQCLGELGEQGSKGALVTCLKDRMWYVRMHAIRALSKIAGPECVPDIADLLNDKAWLVRDSVKRAMMRNIEASLPYIEKILHSDAHRAKRDCIEALEESGYLMVLLKNILSGDERLKKGGEHLLEGIIKSGGHSGLESALSGFGVEPRNRIVESIKGISKSFADHVDKKLKHMLNES